MRTNTYYIGIDNGGTLSKASIFSDSGEHIATASERVPMITPSPGFTERDMEELWVGTARVIRRVIHAGGIDPREIRGAACTGHGKGLYLWGRDGKPCSNGIISTDTRAWEYPLRWQQDGTADRVFKKTYQDILACQPVSLLNWMKDHNPGVIDAVKWIFEVKDYIRYRLTGEAYAEITDYSGSGLLNCAEKRFDIDLLKEFGLEDLMHALPPLRNSTDVCGKITPEAAEVTGLAEGTPVAGGMFDIDACAAAMDITNEDHAAVIAGTWSINEYISREPVLDRSVMMNSLYCIDGFYLIEESSPTSAGNHAWFTEMFLQEEKVEAEKRNMSLYEHCSDLAADIAPDGQNIIFLPYLYGGNYDPRAKACLIGMDSHHTRAHMIRAVMEGIAFCHKVHLDKLLANREFTKSIRLAGGAASSRVWTEIFCDVFGLPVEIIDAKELGTLGCAMAAAVASGRYADLTEASGNMVKISFRLEPNIENKRIYEKKYQLYRKVSSALKETWKDFS